MRSIDDVRSFLSMDNTGTSETAASPGWRIIHAIRPDIKAVVVRRPIEDVVKSLLAIDLSGIAYLEPDLVRKSMNYMTRYLDQIVENVPGVIEVQYSDLANENTCAKIFEHCTGYAHNHEWWKVFSETNLQIDSRALMRYRLAFRPQILAFKSACKAELRRMLKAGEIAHE